MGISRRKIWIKTYGCQMNMRDSDTLKALLVAQGHEIVDDETLADLVLLNTCSIRKLAENKAIGKAGRLLKNKKKNPQYRIGILGCMASRRQEGLLRLLPQLDWIVPPQNLPEVPRLIEETLANDKDGCTVVTPTTPFDFRCYEAPVKSFPTLFVPIQQGCNMGCSYCIVPKTRGGQQNRPFESIVREVELAAHQGIREVTLLGQIVNAYKDPVSSKDFSDLLTTINSIEGIERIRFISPHPTFFNASLIRCFSTLDKLCPSIHLPVQSGSNRILKAMRRPYTREKVLEIIQKLRAIHPQLSISTDIIVGFPGETEADFEETYQLFDEVKFDMAYIFKYSPRPTTLASDLQTTELGIDEGIKELRNQRLLSLLTLHSLAYNRQFLNTTQRVLVEGKAHRGNRFFGRTPHNKKVIFDGSNEWVGSFKTIHIEQATSSVLEGCCVS